MRNKTCVAVALAVLMLAAVALSACAVATSPAPSSPAPTLSAAQSPVAELDWSIRLLNAETKEKLHSDAGVTRYDGTTGTMAYDDVPKQGDVFLLVQLTLKKTKPGGAAFSWASLSVRDAGGSSYFRMENDAFLPNHNFERLPGTDLKLGENTGWVCFEIPTGSAKGKLTLEYGDAMISEIKQQP